MLGIRDIQSMAKYSSALLFVSAIMVAYLCFDGQEKDPGQHIVWAIGCAGVSFLECVLINTISYEANGEIKSGKSNMAIFVAYMTVFTITGTVTGIQRIPKSVYTELWYASLGILGVSNLLALKAMYDWIRLSNELRSQRLVN